MPVDLPSTLADMAVYLSLPFDTLCGYTENYPYRDVPSGDFPHSAIWNGEGALLYALVRELKPRRILELGTHSGGSATVMATAVDKNGLERGYPYIPIDCVDINPEAGWLIPEKLRNYLYINIIDIDEWIDCRDATAYDFIYEDAAHSFYQVQHVYQNLAMLLKPGGVIVSHDTLCPGVGEYVRGGMQAAGVSGWREYQINDSQVGLSVFKYEG